jgi:hypothetical protein
VFFDAVLPCLEASGGPEASEHPFDKLKPRGKPTWWTALNAWIAELDQG